MSYLSLPYAHAWETVKKGIDEKGPYYTLSYWFDDWSYSDRIANELTGYTARIGDLTKRVPPHQFPLSPNLFCTDVVIEGVGEPNLNPAGDVSYWGGFFAHVTYRSSTMMLQGQMDENNDHQIDRNNPIIWATQELDFEVQTINHQAHQNVWFTSDALNGKKTGIPLVVKLGITSMTITFPNLPYLPSTLIRAKRCKLNSTDFLGAPPETVMFMGGRTHRDYNKDGTVVQNVVLHFKERDVSWNKYLRKDKLEWAYIQDSGGLRVFGTTDLNPLIRL